MGSTPVCTYRLQLQPGFGFARAQATLPYLQQLGVSHLYLSPIWKPRPGSTHGYDVVDPRQLNPELGTRGDFDALAADCHARGMGIVLDIVPNHMAADELNPWWRDVLLNGRGSRFAHYFEIDWDRGVGKLILPLLGSDPDEAIATGDLHIDRAIDGEPTLRYFERALPLAEGSAGERAPGGEAVAVILERQHYRLIHWREAPQRVNYRRFCDINELAALRVEDDDVFRATHAFIGELVAMDGVDGVRVDHVDGLRDPLQYLQRLRALVGDGFIWVEKMLGDDEEVPAGWPTDGTTGYEVQGLVDGLMVTPVGLSQLDEAYERLAGPREAFNSVVFESKLETIHRLFPGALEALAQLLPAAAGAPDRPGEEWTRSLAFLTAAMPCYRTYITGAGASAQDRRMVAHAVDGAVHRGGDEQTIRRIADLVLAARDGPALDFAQRWQQFSGPVAAKGLEDTAMYRDRLLISLDAGARAPGNEPLATAVSEFHAALSRRANRFPAGLSASSTHDSKLSEDVRHRIAFLAQVSVEWERCVAQWRLRNRPMVRTAGGTRVPDASTEWAFYQTLIGTWPGLAGVDAGYVARLQRHMTKVEREACLRTSWLDPDEAYEQALSGFVADVLGDPSSLFVRLVDGFASRIAWHATLESLSATVLKIAAPGVPDFFQGTEAGALRLVDPDNRDIVDFGPLARKLEALDALNVPATRGWWRDELTRGLAKMRVIRDGLRARRSTPRPFSGSFEPLGVEGPRADHVAAFARRADQDCVVTVVPRLTAGVCRPGRLPVGTARWGDTAVVLPPGFPTIYRQAIGEGLPVWAVADRLPVARALAAAPVAMLLAEA
jgi:(1->4)-alpha-D-glucan 1-alpha-D-glucosylmutase